MFLFGAWRIPAGAFFEWKSCFFVENVETMKCSYLVHGIFPQGPFFGKQSCLFVKNLEHISPAPFGDLINK